MLAYYLQGTLSSASNPYLPPMAPTKDREWTVRNVIERLTAIRRDKIVLNDVEFEKFTTREAGQQRILDNLKLRL
jgi:hypothetical protein